MIARHYLSSALFLPLTVVLAIPQEEPSPTENALGPLCSAQFSSSPEQISECIDTGSTLTGQDLTIVTLDGSPTVVPANAVTMVTLTGDGTGSLSGISTTMVSLLSTAATTEPTEPTTQPASDAVTTEASSQASSEATTEEAPASTTDTDAALGAIVGGIVSGIGATSEGASTEADAEPTEPATQPDSEAATTETPPEASPSPTAEDVPASTTNIDAALAVIVGGVLSGIAAQTAESGLVIGSRTLSVGEAYTTGTDVVSLAESSNVVVNGETTPVASFITESVTSISTITEMPESFTTEPYTDSSITENTWVTTTSSDTPIPIIFFAGLPTPVALKGLPPLPTVPVLLPIPSVPVLQFPPCVNLPCGPPKSVAPPPSNGPEPSDTPETDSPDESTASSETESCTSSSTVSDCQVSASLIVSESKTDTSYFTVDCTTQTGCDVSDAITTQYPAKTVVYAYTDSTSTSFSTTVREELSSGITTETASACTSESTITYNFAVLWDQIPVSGGGDITLDTAVPDPTDSPTDEPSPTGSPTDEPSPTTEPEATSTPPPEEPTPSETEPSEPEPTDDIEIDLEPDDVETADVDSPVYKQCMDQINAPCEGGSTVCLWIDKKNLCLESEACQLANKNCNMDTS